MSDSPDLNESPDEESLVEWWHHWRLAGDPFADRGCPSLQPATQERAILQILDTIERRSPALLVEGVAGVGKTTVVEEALRRAWSADLKVLRCPRVASFQTITDRIARDLGRSATALARSPIDRNELRRLLSLYRLQRYRLILVLDDLEPGDHETQIVRLPLLETHPDTHIRVIATMQSEAAGQDSGAWRNRLVVQPLTFSEACEYLKSRLLQVGGQAESMFTNQAMGRLHAESEGVPARLNELARKAMIAATSEHSAIVDEGLVVAIGLLEDPISVVEDLFGGGRRRLVTG